MHKPAYARMFSGLSVGEVVDLSFDDGNNKHTKMTTEVEAEAEDKGGASVGLLSKRASVFARHVNMYQFFYEYRGIQLVTMAIFFQRLGFAFKRVDTPVTYDEAEQFLDSMSDVTAFVPAATFEFTFNFSASLVLIFVATFLVQETVEFKKFIFPNSLFYNGTWLLMTGICALSSGLLAIPICTYLLKIADCTEFPPGGR